MVINKWNIPRSVLLIGDIKIKQVRKIKYIRNVLTDGRKCDNQIQKHIEIAKYTFDLLRKVL